MKVIYGINRVGTLPKPVVALGVFDGVHRGHRVILHAAVKKARAIGGTSVAMTFWPHPQGKESLYSIEHRLRVIAEIGIDVCIVVVFNKRFAAIGARDFVKKFLCGKLHVSVVYVGRDYRFGKNAEGTIAVLRELSRLHNFAVVSCKTLQSEGKPISSTVIRSLIKKGKLSVARELLSRPVSILGTVVRGVSWAGRMGFPTANIVPHHEVIPPAGIYAVKAVCAGKTIGGVCYIGTDPTLRLRRPLHVEVHIFNFKKNIYGNDLEIQFIKRIRGEKKFPSTEALIAQIHRDIIQARKILSSR